MSNIICIMLMSFVLTACGEDGKQEVQQWMDQVKQATRPFISQLAEPKDFIAFTYDPKNELDPFNPVKLQSALAKMGPGSAYGIKPDLDRRREALESFPLDTLKMVGTLNIGMDHYALLEADSKGVYQVKAGNYIGSNFGLVTKVNVDSIEIKEIYLDSGGDWAERTQKLALQDERKNVH